MVSRSFLEYLIFLIFETWKFPKKSHTKKHNCMPYVFSFLPFSLPLDAFFESKKVVGLQKEKKKKTASFLDDDDDDDGVRM